MIALRLFIGFLIGGCLMAGVVAAQSPPTLDSRAVEQAIELAWMADPITFPYDLRAIIRGGVVEVHGAVPDTFVRKQALNIARLHHHSKALDQTDLAPASAKSFVAVPSDQVVARIQSAIARALPQLAASVTAQCDPDGIVTLSGTIPTHAEKLACGELMRRVPGCQRVQNALQVSSLSPTPQPVQAAAHNATQANDGGADRPTTNPSTEFLRTKLGKLLPQAAGLAVYQTGPNRYVIQFAAASDAAAGHMAQVIFNHPDCKQLRIDINANVPR